MRLPADWDVLVHEPKKHKKHKKHKAIRLELLVYK